ncbi:alpha/beta fold hydrolase [Aquipseudomonas campi]|uniref:Alpha/beta fold hydrolase n=1 Tax=Aquipseudomonas campi TaxID=2731681 RepID=A0A6M8G536_9GAMM|nr:alpha/beta fold hydrolase [Pseudomonas campi]QKE64065.1 alpha/beta fold hydrolase [Pseudomonas campi]
MHKPHLLLLPGLLCDARLWQHQAADLADLAHITVADLSQADSIAGLAEQVLAQAPDECFALAGLSMGGYVALEIMRRAPQRVLGLALLDTSAQADSDAAKRARVDLMGQAEEDFAALVASLLPKFVHPAHLSDPALIEVITGMAHSLGRDVFLRQQKAMLGRIDSRPGLVQIRCPTLVLCGWEDVITPLTLHQELATAIVGAQLVMIKECGHLSCLEQPQAVTRALETWLQRLPG